MVLPRSGISRAQLRRLRCPSGFLLNLLEKRFGPPPQTQSDRTMRGSTPSRKMERIKLPYFLAFAIAGLAPLFHLACSRSSDESISAPKLESAPVASTASTPSLAAVNASLKAGAFDDAAARLLELQASGRNFSQREAGEYRRA